MPKRKRDKCDDYDYLSKKIRKLEKQLRRRRGRHSVSPPLDSESFLPQNPQESSPILTVHDERDFEEVDTQTLQAVEPPAAALNGITEDDTACLTRKDSNSESPLELDSELLEILGEDPSCQNEFGKDIQKDLAIRLNHIATTGLGKEKRKDLKEKYPIPGNCKLIRAPILNPEMQASLIDSQSKRDKGIENKQTMTACALSSVAEAITLLMSSDNKTHDILKILMDSARILGDIQFMDSSLRRNFVLSSLKKDLKEQLEKCKIDQMLFGDNLPETLKSAKIISKSGAELRSSIKPISQNLPKSYKMPNRALNWKAPPPNRRMLPPPPPGTLRRTYTQVAPATTVRPVTAPQQQSSFKTSSRQPYLRQRR